MLNEYWHLFTVLWTLKAKKHLLHCWHCLDLCGTCRRHKNARFWFNNHPMGRLYNYCGKHAILFCNDATFEKHHFPQHQEKTVADCSATNYTKKWRILRHCRTVLTYYYHLLSPVCFKYIWIGVKSWIWFILIWSQFWNTIFEKLKKQLKHEKYPDLPLISLELLKIPTKKLCG